MMTISKDFNQPCQPRFFIFISDLTRQRRKTKKRQYKQHRRQIVEQTDTHPQFAAAIKVSTKIKPCLNTLSLNAPKNWVANMALKRLYLKAQIGYS